MKGNAKDITMLRQDPEFFFKLGMKHANKKSFEKALKFISSAIALNPLNPDYQFNYACVLAELKETDKSTKVLKMILTNIDPEFYECYFCIGCNYFEKGKIKKAVEYFKKYISVDPEGQFAEEAHEIIFYLQAYGKTIDTSCEVSPVQSGWKREWDLVIECALRNREFTYKPDYKNELKEILKRFVKKADSGNEPIIRKSETWAAALEYIYCSMHLIKVSKKSLAKKYRISPSSLYSKLKNLGM
ncbi:MAG TPA: tetratricopeptide repeat protein [Clostridia bacterium]|nr:tetratricopeptide repeat protein [Clostridia bacterium]